MGGQFHHKNAGKRGISLNVRHPKGLEIARQLAEVSDVVAEGFSPGVMERWGLGYDELTKLRRDVIYVQQSGMGSFGTYGRLRAVGPIAASFVGLSEMSGLPSPSQPAGWGYSYLDWVGAYSFSIAILAGLLHRNRTGEGQWIDASQCEAGLFVTGTAVPDWSVNGRPYSRTGNRSPYRLGAPHGIYRCDGEDRWLAMACFDDPQWESLAKLLELDDATRARFATLADRSAAQDELDAIVTSWTRAQDPYEAMHLLQRLGIPAGVCQNAADRCDRDPQLVALEWLEEVEGTRIGTWPIPEVPAKLQDSPAYIGGRTQRGAPMYGEDNHLVLGGLLNYSDLQIEELEAEGVI
jgi:crotonobetainyl-CoA:carnitine CoA-transferase CaiB-like acyl-CoA transferase